MVVHDAGGCHSDRDTVSSHFCQGSFNQRLRGDGRSLKDLLSALGSIGVDPRLLQNAACRIGGCYCDLVPPKSMATTKSWALASCESSFILGSSSIKALSPTHLALPVRA